jgi:hypothetical protein
MSKETNHSDSQKDVVSTATHVLAKFEDMVRTEMPGTSTVYDEELTFDSALKKFFSSENYEGNGNTPLPLFAYNRSVMVDSEQGWGMRAKNGIGTMKVGTAPNQSLVTYSAAYGVYDIAFIYITRSIQQMEQFEVVYNSNEGITGTRELTLDMDDLGSFKYFLEYGQLGSKEIVKDTVYYKAVFGTVKCRGFYFTFRSSSAMIKEINSKIYVYTGEIRPGELVASTQVVP